MSLTWAAATELQPSGAAFDIVLLLHVACVVVGLGTVVVSGVQAARLLRVPSADRLPDELRTYYSPGTNWAGKVLVGVPIFGFALLAMSRGAYRVGDWWVLVGLLLWVVAIGLAEGALWPVERRIATVVTGVAAPAPGQPGAAAPATAAAPDRAAPASAQPPWHGDCRRVVTVAGAVVAVLLVASVIMVAH